MVVNLATPQYTVQDLTYRNEQGRTAPPPPPTSFLDQTELELKAQRAKKIFLETPPPPPPLLPSPNLLYG